jgi:RNA polymerase sigma-70 factor, ECF subfamily
MSDEATFDAAWRDHRAYLVDLAFRMLRDVGEAEDVVQVTFSQLLQSGIEHIDDPRAWLTVVTSRLCLNRIQSAQHRREQSQDPEELPDREIAITDPADRITLDDRVSLALFVMLERLSGAERVAFVLHDIFATPFDQVAESLGRTPAGCRQLARRARHKLEDATGRHLDVANAEHREVTQRFISACAGGDLGALIAILAPDVSGDSDYGRRIALGADDVATNLLRYWSGQATNFWGVPVTLVSQLLADQAALLAYVDRRLAGVIVLDINHQKVYKIHVIGNADRLAFVDAQLRGVRTM